SPSVVGLVPTRPAYSALGGKRRASSLRYTRRPALRACPRDRTTVFQSVNSVTIVGAGSAGWLTALVLSTYCPSLKIRLVRPRANNPIGVGESTQPDLPMRVQAAGIDLADF